MNTEAEENYLQQAAQYAKIIKQRTPITEFRKGMIFQQYGRAYRVIKVNKISINVYRVGMRKTVRTEEDKKYCTRAERVDKLFLDKLLNDTCYEMSCSEVAFLLNASRVLLHKREG